MWLDYPENYSLWAQKTIAQTVSRLTKLFHAPQTRCGVYDLGLLLFICVSSNSLIFARTIFWGHVTKGSILGNLNLVTPYEMSAIRNPCKYIEAEIRWPIFCRQYFQMHFPDLQLMIFIRMSLKPVKDLINDTISLVQMMAWRRGDKPLSEPKKA